MKPTSRGSKITKWTVSIAAGLLIIPLLCNSPLAARPLCGSPERWVVPSHSYGEVSRMKTVMFAGALLMH